MTDAMVASVVEKNQPVVISGTDIELVVEELRRLGWWVCGPDWYWEYACMPPGAGMAGMVDATVSNTVGR